MMRETQPHPGGVPPDSVLPAEEALAPAAAATFSAPVATTSLRPETLDGQACALVRHGIARLQENTRASLADALRCFDEALRLRRRLPLGTNPWFAYNLAAAWLNRGDALTRLGADSPHLAHEAVRSFDEALAVMQPHLPAEVHPLFRRRHVIAWMNRGIALQAAGADPAEALRSFDQALAALNAPPALGATVSGQAEPQENMLAAGVWMNRGNALLQVSPPRAMDAWQCAGRALALIRKWETSSDPSAVETGLKARNILCQATAAALEQSDTTDAGKADLIASATDAVEDALALARRLAAGGDERIRPMIDGLFCFGLRVYQLHQPHFLPEFLLDHLDPSRSRDVLRVSAEVQRLAIEALAHPALSALPREFSALAKTLHELRLARERLLELAEREQHCALPASPAPD